MEILYCIFTALCLCIGFYFGFKIGRTNELPKVKPRKEIKQQKEKDRKVREFEAELNNLNRYNGTSEGQEEII